MNTREQYRQFLHFAPGVRPPNFDPGPLLSTWDRWKTEGLPPELDPHDYDTWCDAFGLDHWPLSVSYQPPRPPLFAEQILEESETTVTKRMGDGSIQEHKKGTLTTIPHELRPAVTTRDEWERLKAWLAPDTPQPAATEPAVTKIFAKAKNAQRPVSLHAGSLVGMVRNWLGFERFAMMPYDDPEWLDDMFETCCRQAEWQVRLFGENRVPLEVIHFWEDICYKNGPIMNPAHFRKMVTPRYRRVAEIANRYGYDRLEVDSDGNMTALIEPWLEGGINILCPLEVQAGMEIDAVQAKYGRRLLWTGGIHKSRLAGGDAAIVAELNRVKPALERGGYLPMLDHNIPAEISLPNYLLYLRRRHDILGLGTGRIPWADR